MSCKRHHMINFLFGILVPLVSVVSRVDGAFVIVNRSGRDLATECGGVSWTISVGERIVFTAAQDGGLEVLGRLELFQSIRRHHLHPRCRVEAGNCFLSWDPINVSPDHSISEINSSGDYEWEVDKTGVSLILQSVTKRISRSGLNGRREYEMLWQPTSRLFSGATQCMCASPSSPLAQALYSILLYFRE